MNCVVRSTHSAAIKKIVLWHYKPRTVNMQQFDFKLWETLSYQCQNTGTGKDVQAIMTCLKVLS